MLDVLRPKIETQFNSWGSCIPTLGNHIPGERLSEVTVMLRAKFRNYLQAIVEKLVENVSISGLKLVAESSLFASVNSPFNLFFCRRGYKMQQKLRKFSKTPRKALGNPMLEIECSL